MTNSFTPAYAMNPDNEGTFERRCACGETFTAGKTSVDPKCPNCHTADKSEHCGRCAGTGQFITGTTNGIPTGPGGQCFRCGGKGYQNQKDMRRNDYYDAHRVVL
jgi:hypothetical protein